MTDEAQAKWAAAFVAAQANMPDIAKNKTANMGTYSYKYAAHPDILNSVRPVLREHGLAVAQSPEPHENGIGVFTRIIHEAGHIETFGPVVVPAHGNAQAVGSAITYARRYGLCAALNIAADEDDDAKATAQTVEPPQQLMSPTVLGWLQAGVAGEDILTVATETARDMGNPEPAELADIHPKKYDAAYLQMLKANVQARFFKPAEGNDNEGDAVAVQGDTSASPVPSDDPAARVEQIAEKARAKETAKA